MRLSIYESAKLQNMLRFFNDSMILITTFNAAYMHMFLNWQCYVKKLQIPHFVWLQEAKTSQLITNTNITKTYYSPEISYKYNLYPFDTEFRSKSFNQQSVFKLITTYFVFFYGTHEYIWFSDVDVVFLKDPRPFFSFKCDYEYATNVNCKDSPEQRHLDKYTEGNTGFHMFKRQEIVMNLIKTSITISLKQSTFDEQTIFWKNLLHNYSHLKYCPLSRKTHVSGMCFHEIKNAVVLHANWISGYRRKQQKLKKNSLWCYSTSFFLYDFIQTLY